MTTDLGKAALFAVLLDAIPEDEREVVTLRFRDGLTRDQVAARLGRTVAAVDEVEARFLRSLRDPPGPLRPFGPTLH
jgi:DNA-directed RNA polymerase specialized sigma24 family protein